MNGIVNKLIIIIFIFTSTTLYSEVIWANKVISYSSQAGNKQYSANQSLGQPNTFQNIKNPASWMPIISDKDKFESIQLGFESNIKTKYIYINMNLGEKSLKVVNIFDNYSNEKSVFSNDNIIEDNNGKIILRLGAPQIITSIKLFFDLKNTNSEVQLDAVGIGNDTNNIWKINQIADTLYTSEPENLGFRINSIYSELAPIISADGKKLFFTRDGHPENVGADKNQDVWMSELEDDSRFGKAVNLYGTVNNKYNNFAFSTNTDGTMLLLGRNALNKDLSNLSYVEFKNKKWSELHNFDFTKLHNTTNFVNFSLSQSMNLMFVSMEREDSYGGLDIYYSMRTDSGWSEIKNLGPKINTAADEITPYLANDNRTLYFASNGHPGYGSMDLFVSNTDDSLQVWTEPVNLGKNINTDGWEAYFTISQENNYAYYVSTSNSIGKEDIFRIMLPRVIQPGESILINGKVNEINSTKPLLSKIEFRDIESNKIEGIAYSDSLTGLYQISLPVGKTYGVDAYAAGFYSYSKIVNIDTNYSKNSLVNIELKKIEKGQTYNLNNVFFEFAKSDLNKKSINELHKLIDLLESDKLIRILIIGYTDKIGSNEKNQKLSEERAKSVYNYLIEKGIDKNRLNYEGKGELKSNKNGNLEESRRVEFQIVEDSK